MCEAHVSGCQFAFSADVSAHAIPAAVRPARTWVFSVTYCGSSHSTKPWRSTGAYAANVTSSSNNRAGSRRGLDSRILRGMYRSRHETRAARIGTRCGPRPACGRLLEHPRHLELEPVERAQLALDAQCQMPELEFGPADRM